MRELVIFIFLLSLVTELKAFNEPQKLYVFEDNAIRRISVRFVNDSTIRVADNEETQGFRRVTQFCFTDEYRYTRIGERKALIKLINTDRKDLNYKKEAFKPARFNYAAEAKCSRQIFPLMTECIISYSEDFSLLKVEEFIFEAKENVEWIMKTNLVSPLLVARLGFGKWNGLTYKYCDRKDRNLSLEFIDGETIKVKNIDLSSSDYSFEDTYKIEKYTDDITRYKIIKLISTTRQDRKEGPVFPPLSSEKINSYNNIFPVLENTEMFFNLSCCMLQIGQFTFRFSGELIPFG